VSDTTRSRGMFSRRDFGRILLASAPAAGLIGRGDFAFGFQSRPNSTWGGVPFGIFAPYRFGPEASDLEGALRALVKFGVSNTELSAAVVERYLGAPTAGGNAGRAAAASTAPPGGSPVPVAAGGPAPGAIPCVNGVPQPAEPGARGRGGRGGQQTPEQQAAAAAQSEAMLKWRTSVPMSKFAEVRKKFDDAGVSIYAFRYTLNLTQPDTEYDYVFNAAKALGVSQITMELPADLAVSKRIGEAAAAHGMNVAYHLHTTASMTAWDAAMAQSPRNGIQLDAGHYVAGIGGDPVAFIEKHHARIYSLHLKDRKKLCHDGSENMPWGQGDTPLRAILQTLKKNHWAIPAGVEFEYNVPAGSTWEAEIAKCVQYARDALA
jgi:sugar phosphate isomerase/epimerase